MERLINNFSVYDNFWDCNPNMRLIKEFNEVYEVERQRQGKREQRQGLLMWAIALLVDRHPDNPYRNLREDDRKTLIAEEFLHDPTFNWRDPEIDKLVKVYKTYCLSPVERALIQIENKLNERESLIENTKYTMENADDIDKLILKTKQLKDVYKELKAEVEMEQSIEGTTKGGRSESAGEKGLL